MANEVYVHSEDGITTSYQQIHISNEDKLQIRNEDKLQRILERNPELIPGDQIDPDKPRRWLIVKREMSVPDPSLGSNTWSLDFLFADQDATPTLESANGLMIPVLVVK